MCYDVDRFIDERELIEKFICPICLNVLCCTQFKETVPNSKQDSNGHAYCEVCINDWLKNNNSCPDCRVYLDESILQPLNSSCKNALKSLKIKCSYFDKGCSAIEILEIIEEHESKCKYGPQFCTTCNDCYEVVYLPNHREIDCLRIKCNKLEKQVKKFNQILPYIKLQRPEIIEIAKIGNIIKMNELIKSNADLNYKDEEGFTPLIRASENGHLAVVKMLVENGANKNEKSNNKNGSSALMWASYGGHLEIVKYFIDKGVCINDVNNNGDTALIMAAVSKNIHMVKLLVENGANVNHRNNKGLSALQLAQTDQIHEYLNARRLK